MTTGRGMVRWPDPADGWRDTGEGGLTVWAVVAEEGPLTLNPDTSVAVLTEPDAPLHDSAEPDWPSELWRTPAMPTHGGPPDTNWPLDSGQLAAAVLLGTSRQAWARRPDGTGYFLARGPEDLTEDGRKLVELLEQATGGTVRLLTMLDT